MKKILLLSVVLCTLFAAQAQRVYFVYLQSENRTPFFVRMGEKVYSSSTEGYLIVPKLVDSTYSFVIGKVNRAVPEARFAIPINQNDRGFLIREADNKLSLFDFQSMAVIEASASSNAGVSYTRKTDGFTMLLSQAADDTTLLNVPIIAKVEKPKKADETAKAPVSVAITETPLKVDTAVSSTIAETSTVTADVQSETNSSDTVTAIAAETQGDTSAIAQTETTNTEQEIVTSPVIETPGQEYKRSVVSRRAESSTSDGFGLVFLDNINGATDTIRILIPNPKVIFGEGAEAQAVEDKQFLPMEGTAASADSSTAETTEEVAVVQKDACAAMATESDMAKLKRSIAAKSNEDQMVSEASKQFNGKCFTTEQIKSLSTLILTPKGKYNLFNAAYSSVSDKDKFAVLESELKADYFYMNRFKALIAK